MSFTGGTSKCFTRAMGSAPISRISGHTAEHCRADSAVAPFRYQRVAGMAKDRVAVLIVRQGRLLVMRRRKHGEVYACLPGGKMALFYNSGSYGKEQLYMKSGGRQPTMKHGEART